MEWLSWSTAVEGMPWDGFLQQTALRSFCFLLVSGLMAVLLRKASARARYRLWCLTLCALLALPLLMQVLPSVPVPLLGSGPGSGSVTQAELNLMEPARSLPLSGRGPGEAAIPWTGWWPSLAALWLFGLGAILCRWLIGHYRLCRIRRRASRVTTPDWSRLFDEVRKRLRLRRPVSLLASPEVNTPMTWGLRRPVILIPAEPDFSDSRLRRMVLSHELIHVQQKDVLFQNLARLASALYWFNPLVRVVTAGLRRERERVCDERVLELGFRPSDYAEHLLEMAGRATGSSGLPSLAMARGSELEGRLLAILQGERGGKTKARVVVVMSLFVGLVVAGLAAARPVAREGSGFAEAAPMQAKPAGEQRFKLGVDRLEVEIKGVEIDPQLGITAIEPGGFLRVEQSQSGRRIEVFPGASGELQRRYFEDGEEKPWSREADALLEEGLRSIAQMRNARRELEQAQADLQDQIARRQQELNQMGEKMMAERERTQVELQRAHQELERALERSEVAQSLRERLAMEGRLELEKRLAEQARVLKELARQRFRQEGETVEHRQTEWRLAEEMMSSLARRLKALLESLPQEGENVSTIAGQIERLQAQLEELQKSLGELGRRP